MGGADYRPFDVDHFTTMYKWTNSMNALDDDNFMEGWQYTTVKGVPTIIRTTAAKDSPKVVSSVDPMTGEINLNAHPHTEGVADGSEEIIGIESESFIEPVISTKAAAKSEVKQKFSVGDKLILKGGVKDGSVRNIKTFIVKKVIWKVKSEIVNVLVLKQIDGTNRNKYTLNKKDCLKYHIKYEPGLQVYSMKLNFIKAK